MDTLLAVVLELLQISGELPEGVKAAQKKLEASPDDAKANQVMGIYLLSKRDPAAIDHLKKASDPALKRAATLDAEGDYLKAAKAWYNAKIYPAKERAAVCLEKLWTGAQDPAPLRSKLAEFAAPPKDFQKYERAQAAGWWPLTDEFGSGVDSRFAWTAAKSLKLLPNKGGKINPDAWASAETLNVPVGPAKRVIASAYIFAYETDFGGQLNVYFRDATGKQIGSSSVAVMPDQPFWKRYELSADVPAGTILISLRFDFKITKGAVWCDELNVVDGARDLFMGGGFER